MQKTLSQQLQMFSMNHKQQDNWDQVFQFRQEDDIPECISCDELETIQEEDDEFQYCSQVEKLSQSGIMYNNRILSLDQEYLCYYSQIKVSQNKKINTLKHKPKARIQIKDISDIIIPADKPNTLRISGSGPVYRKDNKVAKNQKFQYTFRFINQQMPELWRNIILAAQEANKSKSYLVTFDNLMKFSRANSS